MVNDSHVKMNGTMLRSLLESCGLLRPRVWKMLEDRGFAEITPDGWYAVDDVLQVLEEVVRDVGANGLAMIGQRMMQTFDCTSEYGSFAAALFALDQMYKQVHTGDALGSVKVDELESRHWLVQADTPYPPDFVLGILRGLCRQYKMLVRIESRSSDWRSGEFVIFW